MIRDRRPEDLDRLTVVLEDLDRHRDVLGGRSPDDWLREVDAEFSWVFDQAPVSVAPTSNVVGHVQVYSLADAPRLGDLGSRLGRPVEDVLVIGRLFVKRVRHDDGIVRFLLTQAVEQVEERGGWSVLDADGLLLVPDALPARLGFVERDVDGSGVGVWTRER